MAELKVYVTQKPDTPKPTGTITGIITEQKSPNGTPKFKKAKGEEGGQIYTILTCSEGREWKGNYGSFVDYDLELEAGLDLNKQTKLKTYDKVPPEAPQSHSEAPTPKDRKITRMAAHKSAAALLSGTVDPGNEEQVKKFFGMVNRLVQDTEGEDVSTPF